MPRLVLLLALAVALPLGAARAADCRNPQTQMDMNTCAGQDFQKADAALNALYRQMQARLKDDPDQTRRLMETQRAWVAFRDAECRFVGQPGPAAGALEPRGAARGRAGRPPRGGRGADGRGEGRRCPPTPGSRRGATRAAGSASAGAPPARGRRTPPTAAPK